MDFEVRGYVWINMPLGTLEERQGAFLQFLNLILRTMGKDEIADVKEFKLINRHELTDINMPGLEAEYVPILYGPFQKLGLKHYERKRRKFYLGVLLKALCEYCECKLATRKGTVVINKVIKGTTYYTIS